MNVKKTAIAAVSYAMVAALAIGGTLAYQQDETLTDANVMTLGNVNIEQNEWQRQQNADGTYVTDTVDGMKSYILEKYQQDKEIVPVVVNPGSGVPGSGYEKDTTVRMSQVGSRGGMDVFEADNAVDKFVTVTNTGKTDAYVRTLVAVEKGKTDGSKVWFSSRATDKVEDAGVKQPWLSEEVGTITIQGNEYLLFEYVYMGALASSGYVHKDGVLPAGETTYPSIAQFYLRAETTNEDIENLDGNKNGKLDILVVSQAVQADMDDLTASEALDKAFGEITETTHPWTETAFVDSADELSAALAAGGEVILTADIDLGDQQLEIPADKEVTLNLSCYDITQEKVQTGAYSMIVNRGTLTIEGTTGVISYADTAVYSADNNQVSNTILNLGVLNVNGGTIENVSGDNVKDYGYPHAIDVYQGSTTNITGGTVRSANYDCIRMFCNSSTVPTIVNISGGNIINRVSFQNPTSARPGYGVLNITGGTFTTTDEVNANVRLLNFGTDVSKMKATITGGTFDKGVKTQNFAGNAEQDEWLTIADGVTVNTVQ